MSTTANAQQQRPLCRYFASNICYKGDNCEFSHDRNAKPDMVCRYYLQGTCTYGSRCRFDHVRNTAAQRTSIPAPEKISTTIQKPLAKFSLNSKPFVPASIPASNPWKKDASLNNFHNDLGFELELINDQDICCTSNDFSSNMQKTQEVDLAIVPLCPYFEVGLCQEGEFCRFVHGITCDMCLLNALHPHNEAQRKKHRQDCLAQHERDMEAAFADAKSADKQCGICMESIMEKDLRFAILQNCSHCFCLDCIRKWRKQHNNLDQEVEARTVRGCPECRVHSDFVIPSKTWVDDKEEKDKLIKIFHDNTKKIKCKYIKGSDVDSCPFGNKCFYKHQMPDGTIVEGKSPRTLRRERSNSFLELYEFMLFPLSDDSDDGFDFSFY